MRYFPDQHHCIAMNHRLKIPDERRLMSAEVDVIRTADCTLSDHGRNFEIMTKLHISQTRYCRTILKKPKWACCQDGL
jgi:hypothetical protein